MNNIIRRIKSAFNIKIRNLRLRRIIFRLFDYGFKAISQYEYGVSKQLDYDGYDYSLVVDGATYSGTFSGVTTIDDVAGTLTALGFGTFSVDTDYTSVNYLYVSNDSYVFGELQIGTGNIEYEYELTKVADYDGYDYSLVVDGVAQTGVVSGTTDIVGLATLFTSLGFGTFTATVGTTNDFLNITSKTYIFGNLTIQDPLVNGWQYQAIGISNVSAIFWLDENTGWVGTGVTPFSIYKTADSGVNWTLQTDAIGNFVSKIFFIDTNNGWALRAGGNIIFYTTDGGTTWTASNTINPLVFSDFNFLTNLIGIATWRVGGSGGALVTTDGGINWVESSTGLANIKYEGVSEIYTIITLRIALICGGSYLDNTGSVYRTTDGGANWTALTPPSTNRDYNKVYFPFDSNNGYLLGFKFSPDTTYIYKTTNGGTDWTEILVVSTARYFRDIFFFDANTGWVVGGVGIYKTTDGGTTWVQQNTDTLIGTSNIYIRNISMRNILSGYAVSGSDAGINTNPLTTITGGADTGTGFNETDTPDATPDPTDQFTPRKFLSLNGDRIEIDYTSIPYNGFLNSILGENFKIDLVDIHTNKPNQLQNKFLYARNNVLGDVFKKANFTQINPYQDNNIVLADIKPDIEDFLVDGINYIEHELVESTEVEQTELRLNFKTVVNPVENKFDDDIKAKGEIVVNKPVSGIRKETAKPKKVIKILSPFGIILLKN